MTGWTAVCRYADLVVDRGVAAMVDGVAVAVFRLDDGSVAVVGNRDPISRTNVMSRGLIGSRGDVTYVASPMYKQRFDVASGRCLDNDDVSLPIYTGRVRDGVIEVTLNAPAQAELVG